MENAIKLKAIIENAIDGIITIDMEGTIESINPSAIDLFGFRADDVIGRNISMLMPEPDRSRHDGYLKRYHDTGTPHIIGIGREVSGLRKDGSVFPFRLAVSEVKLLDRKLYTGFIHDLSKQKIAEDRLQLYTNQLELLVDERTEALNKLVVKLQEAKEEVSQSLEKEKELSQMKSRFVSMASHEFRTPLSAIQLSASLINKYAAVYKNPDIEKHVGKIKNSIGNLTTILNDFLSLERLETGVITPHFFRFDLVKLAEEITEDMQVVAKQNQNIIYLHTGVESTVNT
ncbi:MAG: PAS domain S-box protein, partial [Pedobacter sp.]|nr:PAS domain S-box protein [Pedobacter sp.]